MNHKDLRETIRQEIIKALKESIKPINEGLKLNKLYQVYDPGMDEWNDEYEYLGFDINSREHMFRAYDSPGGHFLFVGIPQSDIKNHVKES